MECQQAVLGKLALCKARLLFWRLYRAVIDGLNDVMGVLAFNSATNALKNENGCEFWPKNVHAVLWKRIYKDTQGYEEAARGQTAYMWQLLMGYSVSTLLILVKL